MSAKNFSIGGTLGNTYGWSADVDDDSNVDAHGKLVYDGVTQYQWDLKNTNGGHASVGAGQYICYVVGTTVDNGIWFWHQSTSVDQTTLATHSSTNVKTRDSNQTCNFTTWETTNWQTADAFVNGVIPTKPAGPTVTSIGASVIFVPNDTVSNTDFTLLKDGAAYSNTNITLIGPGPQLPSDGRGYSYSLTYDGTAWYKRTIDSKSYEDFYYDDSWTSDVSGAASNRQTSANRILNVLGKIPSTTTMSISSTSTWTFDKREDHYVRYSGPTNAGQATPEITFVVSGNSTNIVGWFNYYDETDYINSPTFNIGEQQTMSWTPSFLTNTTFSVEDWVYSNEPEGNGYVPPQQPIRTGNGYPDRYPLIMTNLFARQRSIYSIGMTHKDTWDLFL
jgi:hypothetical protein